MLRESQRQGEKPSLPSLNLLYNLYLFDLIWKEEWICLKEEFAIGFGNKGKQEVQVVRNLENARIIFFFVYCSFFLQQGHGLRKMGGKDSSARDVVRYLAVGGDWRERDQVGEA